MHIVPSEGYELTKYVSGAPIETFIAYDSIDVMSVEEAKEYREITHTEAMELRKEFTDFIDSILNKE